MKQVVQHRKDRRQCATTTKLACPVLQTNVHLGAGILRGTHEDAANAVVHRVVALPVTPAAAAASLFFRAVPAYRTMRHNLRTISTSA